MSDVTYLSEDGKATTQNLGDAGISLCNMKQGCGSMTYSILSEDRTHFFCGKCRNTK